MSDGQIRAFCRDCLSAAEFPAPGRCPACHGPRMVSHPDLPDLAIAHLDCDAFYAAIEKRDDPTLADRPVIIGGGARGVVATACYIARTHGVHSAQPMFAARKACPDAVIIAPDIEKYSRVGRQVRTMMLTLTPQVQPLSIDEAFLDLSGTERLHQQIPAQSMAMLANRIETEIGITVSVGLSYNKSMAKLASDLDKPRGFSCLGPHEIVAFLADKPVSWIWGVGAAMQKRLRRDGITRISQLQGRDEAELISRYGSMGERLARFSMGRDARAVQPERKAKSISAETTFRHDISDPGELDRILWTLCEKVARRCKRANQAGALVVLKLRTSDFKIRTRNRTLSRPTGFAADIYQAANELLRKEADGTTFRLLGVGVGSIGEAVEADQGDLLLERNQAPHDIECAIDTLREKFGDTAIGKGRGMSLRPDRPPRK